MMNQYQHLLGKLAEEAAEVAQIAIKASHFGPEEVQPGTTLSNRERVHAELNDLIGIITMLNEEHDFSFEVDGHALAAKRAKVTQYRDLSIQYGLVEGPCSKCKTPDLCVGNGAACEH